MFGVKHEHTAAPAKHHYFFHPFANEISARIVRTFIHLRQFGRVLVAEHTVGTSQHYGHSSKQAVIFVRKLSKQCYRSKRHIVKLLNSADKLANVLVLAQ